MNNDADRKSKKIIYFTHPFAVSFGKIIVDRYEMDAFACKSVQVCGKRRYERFSFAGFHFGDPALMQHDAADQLHVVVPLSQHAPGRLPYDRECFRQKIVQAFSFCKPLLEYSGHFLQGLIRFFLHLRL